MGLARASAHEHRGISHSVMVAVAVVPGWKGHANACARESKKKAQRLRTFGLVLNRAHRKLAQEKEREIDVRRCGGVVVHHNRHTSQHCTTLGTAVAWYTYFWATFTVRDAGQLDECGWIVPFGRQHVGCFGWVVLWVVVVVVVVVKLWLFFFWWEWKKRDEKNTNLITRMCSRIYCGCSSCCWRYGWALATAVVTAAGGVVGAVGSVTVHRAALLCWWIRGRGGGRREGGEEDWMGWRSKTNGLPICSVTNTALCRRMSIVVDLFCGKVERKCADWWE